MDRVEVFALHSVGERNGIPFSPSSIPLSTLETIVNDVPNFVLGDSVAGTKKSEIRDSMNVAFSDGSLTVGVALPAALATILGASGFSSDLAAFAAGRPGEVKDQVRMDAARSLKTNLLREGARSIGFSSHSAGIAEFDIVERDVAVPPDVTPWIDSDSYVMAVVTDLGGKSKVNVHLEIEGRGTVVAESIRQYLSDLTENLLYKKVMAHVAYKVNTLTGEWRNPRLVALENPARRTFDATAFEQAIGKKNGWHDVADPIAEIRKLRGENG